MFGLSQRLKKHVFYSMFFVWTYFWTLLRHYVAITEVESAVKIMMYNTFDIALLLQPCLFTI